ncbi:DNA polymerase III subunit gamma/tau [candidate division KSB1 bacterium]|nr:DNA polymerase III subunit gamma/tau [candidate division KSB1 bacterium]
MSYLVLARKFRPMTFDEVIDQKHVIVTLQNAIKSERLANAYLFAGPRGVGKTTIARIFAKAINCAKGPTITPCNQCSSCIEINQSRNIDVLEIDGASNNGVDHVRNLREKLKYVPSHGKYKIYIIDEVHMLTDSAFNALLKTLEEPPPNVMFIFATTEPNKILPTILSRCQRFDFKRISQTEIINHLRYIATQESITIDEDALHLIARKADGSMRDGQSLLDQAVSFTGDEITGKSIANLLGIIDNEIFFRATDIIKKRDQNEALNLIDDIFVNGFDLNEFLSGLNEHLRNILIAKVTGSADNLYTTDAYAKRYLACSSDFSENDLLRLIKIASDTEINIKRSANPRLKLEIALLNMLRLDNSKRVDDLLDGIHELKNQLMASNITSAATTTSSPDVEKKKVSPTDPSAGSVITAIGTSDDEAGQNIQDVAEIDIVEIKEKWHQFVDDVKKNKIALGSFLNEGEPSYLEGDTLVISFGSRNGFHIKSVMKYAPLLETILYKLFNVHLHLKCIKGNAPSTDSRVMANYSENYLSQLTNRIPQIKTILEVFDGELVR